MARPDSALTAKPYSNPDDKRFNAPLERAFESATLPFRELVRSQTTGGILLIGCAAAAMAIANSPLAEFYADTLHAPLGLRFGDMAFEKPLHFWINDGLMTVFFFLVGLEIKREMIAGELASIRKASLPIAAALGGMIMPALIYLCFTGGTAAARGWGVPMATDIAFAAGVLVLLGNRIPATVVTSLVALAIVDDLGAVLVITLFYTDALQLGALAAAAGWVLALVALNFFGVRRSLPYFIVGLALWTALLTSGIHATLAGVLTAFSIPARPKFDSAKLSDHLRDLLDDFDELDKESYTILHSSEQSDIAQEIEDAVVKTASPLRRIEHGLHAPVGLFIVPVFALANAGIPLDAASLGAAVSNPASRATMFGIAAGLVAGKFLGIVGASWLAVKAGAALPEGASWKHLVGVGLLGGIGFTMSIFIAELAFAGDEGGLNAAKLGIVAASLVAGIAGSLWLYAASRK